MIDDRRLRRLLLIAAAFNFGAAVLFAFPEFFGRLLRMPDALPQAPSLYAALVALFVALFGGSYGWLAWQPVIHRPMIAFAAIGKASAFTVFFLLWLAGAASTPVLLAATGELAFAALFLSWLRRGPDRST